MQELYFVAFISFAALFFMYEHLKPPASAFHDFNKEWIGEKTNFCKIKCYVNIFNKKKSIKVIAYRYSTIIY
jgi:hypothetical protein